MASLDLTAFADILNKLYPNKVETNLFKKCPFFAKVRKTYGFGGASRQIRCRISGIQGANNFSTAQSNKGVPEFKDFTILRKKTYVLGSIDCETIAASKTDPMASAQALKTQVDSALYTFGRTAAHQLWGNYGGARGRRLSISTNTITLTNRRDSVNWELGETMQAASTDGTSGSVRAGSAVVTAINRSAGTITVDSAAGIIGFTNNDYLFRNGDFGTCLLGVQGWIPPTAPTAGDSFGGVDRSADVNRLAGHRYTISGILDEGLMNAVGQMAQNGGYCDTIWMNSERFVELQRSMHSKTYVKVGTTHPKFSLTGLTLMTPMGDVVILSDPNCPYEYCFATEMDSWELAGLKEMPHFAGEDGVGKLLRETSDDALEFRLRAWWQLINHRPINTSILSFA
jgi:hypothetical protein